MANGKDRSGNLYVEFDMSDDEQVRVTYIPHADWAKGPTIRIQKRRASGNTVMGPELPATKADELIESIRGVLKAGANATRVR